MGCNMPVKLIAIDMDDTLLNEDNVVSAGNAAAIAQARAQGIVVTIATGRMYCSALPFAKQLGMDVPLITYNGALIKNSQTSEVIHFQPIDPHTAAAVLQFFQRKGWYIQTYIDDVLYAKEMSWQVRQYEALAKVEAVALGDAFICHNQGVIKMLSITETDQMPMMEEIMQAEFGTRLSIAKSKANFMELTHPQANKGHALDLMARQLGIGREQVMAIGDSTNDLDMIQYAGYGVAMGNASDGVKESARFVTLSNKMDGVAAAIEKYALRSIK